MQKPIYFLVSMGDASYSTYLTHWYIIVVCRKIFSEKLKIYDFYSSLVFFNINFFTYRWSTYLQIRDSPMNYCIKKYLLNNLGKIKFYVNRK